MSWTSWGQTATSCAKPAWRSGARSGAGSVSRTNNLATSPTSPLHTLSWMQQFGRGSSDSANKCVHDRRAPGNACSFLNTGDNLAVDRGTAVLLGTRGWIGVCASCLRLRNLTQLTWMCWERLREKEVLGRISSGTVTLASLSPLCGRSRSPHGAGVTELPEKRANTGRETGRDRCRYISDEIGQVHTGCP